MNFLTTYPVTRRHHVLIDFDIIIYNRVTAHENSSLIASEATTSEAGKLAGRLAGKKLGYLILS